MADPAIRRADARDVEAVARLFRRVRSDCLPYLPVLHTPEDDLWFFRERVFPASEVWVAEAEAILGFCAFRPGWVDHLYVAPECQRQGLGSWLLAKPMAQQAALQLWAFQRNEPAIRFYQARGFREVKRTGGDNEEHEPDVLLAWVRPGQDR